MDVILGKPPSRLPVAPVVGADHAAFRAGESLRGAMSDPGLLAEVLLGAREGYGGDLVVVFSDVTVEAEAMGAEIDWPSGLPPRVVGRPGLGTLRPLDPARDGRLPVVLEAARRVIDAAGGIPVLVSLKGPFSLVALLEGVEPILTSEDDGEVDRALEIAADTQSRFVRAIVDAGGIPLIGDPFASGSVLGPEHFRRLALPGLARLVEEAHRLGSPAALHVCGDTRPVLDPLLRAGADLLHLETTDLAAAASSGAAVMGGVPTEALLGDESGVRRAVRDAIDGIPDRGRFILATACDVPTTAEPARVAAMMDEAGRLA
jgi:MtaA/CmuA family methyltransferase